MRICGLIQDPEALLALEPEELAGLIKPFQRYCASLQHAPALRITVDGEGARRDVDVCPNHRIPLRRWPSEMGVFEGLGHENLFLRGADL